jgi:hypothetical protein
MTIKFVCTCGKHLKARDEMASRRSVCPRCGSPVGIPSLKPTHPGTLPGPMTKQERLAHARQHGSPTPTPAALPNSPEPTSARPIDSRLVHLLASRGVRRRPSAGRHLEKHWYQCLWYPFRAWGLCLGLAVFLTLLSVGVAVALPHWLVEPPSDPVALNAVRLSCVVLPILILGIPCSFLDAVLSSAAAGEVYYWLRCGDPGFLDYLILTELGVVTLAYWAFALLSLTDRGRLRDLNSVAIADLVHRLGWRAPAVVIAAALLLLAHGLALMVGVATVHTKPAEGLSILTAAWLSGIYWSTFFCRLLGVWCHGSRLAGDG